MSRLDRGIAAALSPRVFAWGAIFLPAFAFAAPKIAYWPLVFGGVVALLRFGVIRALPPPSMRPLALWVLATLLWAAVTSFYALDTQAGLLVVVKLAAYAACGLALIGIAHAHGAAMRPHSGRAHVLSGLVLLISMLADYASGGALSNWLLGLPPGTPLANRNATAALYLALFAWPLAAWLRDPGSVWLVAVPPAIALAIAWLFGHAAIVVAVAASALVFAVAFWRPRTTGVALAGICTGYVLLAPLAASLLAPGPWMRSVPAVVQFSVYHRAKVWSFASERIAERPVFGWGIDASRRIPGGDTLIDINRDLGFAIRRYETRAVTMPLHPHSAALQVWLEWGSVGALLLALLCCGLPLACLRASLSRTAMAAGLAGFVTTYLLAMTSFSLWQSRWHIMLWLAAVSAIVLLGGAGGVSTRRDPSPSAARAA